MNSKNLLPLGRVAKSHGIKGDILVILFNENIKFASDLKTIWLGDDSSHIASWEIEKINRSGEKVFLKLRYVETQEEANFLKGLSVYISEESVEEKSIFDAIGFIVINDDTDEKIGAVIEIEQGSMQDLIVFDTINGPKMVPVVEEFIKYIDWNEKEIFITLIEGLI